MKAMKEDFVPRLNEFTELMKEAYALHADNIKRLGNWQKEIYDENQKLREELKQLHQVHQYKNSAGANSIAKQLSLTAAFKEAARESRTAFQEMVEISNKHLGGLSSHWGSFLETFAVQYLLNTLKREYGVHTTFQKFKRWWHKSRNVELDLLAISDTHAYVAEVKNQLKEDTFKQMLTSLEKIKEKIPEYAHLKLQPVFVCVHAEEAVVKTTTMSGVWIIRYCGLDQENGKEEFEWLRKDE